jgi:predicted nuclease of predicted toxin-antitoxin system
VRILLDECVNARLKAAFPEHEVRTVGEIGRRASTDAMLVEAAAKTFDVFVTIDRKLPLQVQIDRLRIGVILIRVPNNTIQAYTPLFAALLRAVENVRPGQLMEVS